MKPCGDDLSARESLPLFDLTEGLIRLGGSANRVLSAIWPQA